MMMNITLLIVLILLLLVQYSYQSKVHDYAKEGKLEELKMHINSNPNAINSKDEVSILVYICN